MANYYSLITGLPDLTMDEGKPRLTIREFRDLCEEQLSDTDKQIVYYFFLKYDCLNIVRLLKNPEAAIEANGNLTVEQCKTLIAEADEMNATVPCGAPRFLMDFILSYPEKTDAENFFPEDAVLLEYYRYTMQSVNKDVAAWFEMNFNMMNILTACLARSYGWKMEGYVQPGNEVSETIMAHPQMKDFNVSPLLDYVDDVLHIADCDDPVAKEKRMDAFRWNWLDDATFFQPFSVMAVLAYLCKLEMTERWERLDVEEGRKAFLQIVENLRGEARVPDEFKKQ